MTRGKDKQIFAHQSETDCYLPVTTALGSTCGATVIRHGDILPLLIFFSGVYATPLNSHCMFMWDEVEYASRVQSVAPIA
jgi:hypothetical protein